MASEQTSSPVRSAGRAPRGVDDLPLRLTPPAGMTPPPDDLAGFKPKRRGAVDPRDNVPAPNGPLPPPEPPATPKSLKTGPLQNHAQRLGKSGRAPILATRRRLIVNADDFGRSHSINQAVIRAHREGILTTASLMVNGEAFEEAVELARQNPTLGVGLHLTLVCGRSACDRLEIPDLVTPQGEFTNSPVAAGLRYFFQSRLRLQLAREIGAQFKKFKATGLVLDHVNGHLNLHLHPTIFGLLAARHLEWGIRQLRITDDPFSLDLRLARGQWLYRTSHALIFRCLSARARRHLAHTEIRSTDRVFGLLQNARVDERYLTRLLPVLPRGDSELYSHPSLDEFRHEFDALVSPRVKSLVTEGHIELIRYQDL